MSSLGSVMSSPSGVRGRAPAENEFWRILKAKERFYLYLHDKNLRGQFALASSYSKFWGLSFFRFPVIYVHTISPTLSHPVTND